MTKELKAIDLKPGDKVKIFAVNDADNKNVRKLAVFGVLPGAEVEVLQIKPAYVIRIGHTELALDSVIVQGISFVQ